MTTEAQKKAKAKMDQFIKAMASTGVPLNEAAEAINKVMRELPPIGEAEIQMIKNNPSLNYFEKRQLIKQIKKAVAHGNRSTKEGKG